MAVASVVPATRVGNYEILTVLGSGGMGVVYKARDLTLHRIVALKFLAADSPDQDRVLREARAASVLDHNNIVAIHSVEQADDGSWFLVMAYYDGQTLEDLLRSGPMPAARAISIAAQVARGLAHAHARGLIHHDIKPANIIVTVDGIAKIVDFGLAHRFDMEASTQSMAFSGTLAYMSPEQIQGGSLDARSDIWSLGVLLYSMLTGRLPFEGRSAAELIWAVLHTLPAPMTGAPDALQLVVLRALAKFPESRYQSCQELLDDLATLQIERRGAAVDLVSDLEHAVRAASEPRRPRPARTALLLVLILVLALFIVPSFQLTPKSARSSTIAGTADAKKLSEAMFTLALVWESKHLPQAGDLFRSAAALLPNDPLATHKLANYYFRRRDYERAVSGWRRVIQLTPDNANAHSNLAMALLKLGRIDEADAEINRARELPHDFGVLSNLGIVLYQQKRWAAAADMYEQAIKFAKENPTKDSDRVLRSVWGNLALAWEWLNQDKAAASAYRQELLLLEPEAARSPNDARMQSKLGLLYCKQKRRGPARAATDRALSLAPDDPRVLAESAETYDILGDRRRAIQLAIRALDRGETLDELDHNPGLRRLLADPEFRARIAERTSSLAAPGRH